MNLIRRINNFMLEEVETERMLLSPEIYFMFNKIREMTPIYRKHMIIGFISNFVYTTMIAIFLYVYRNSYDLHRFSSHLFLLVVSMVLNFVAFVCKLFIVRYYIWHVNPNDRHRRLLETTRRLVFSRVYIWSRRVGQFLFGVNFIEIVFSLMFIFMHEMTHITLLNLTLSVIFLTRMYLNIKDLNKVYAGEMSDGSVREMVMDLKSITISTDSLSRYMECMICFHDFVIGELVKEVNCVGKHIFHESCLFAWFKQKSICPLCKTF
jgi:hypothetical protein